MTPFQLKRLAYIIRKTVEWDLGPAGGGIRLEAVAEELGHGFAAYLKAVVLGQQHSRTVEIDAPDGRWHSLLAGLGLPHRKRRLTFTVAMLFPALQTPPEGASVVVDVDLGQQPPDAS